MKKQIAYVAAVVLLVLLGRANLLIAQGGLNFDAVNVEVKKVADKPIRYIINTDVHIDHAGGNEPLAKADGAKIIAHENVLKVMSGPKDGSSDDRFRAASGARPAETFSDRKTLHFNGEDIDIIHIPTAHSAGDSIVFFRGSNVVSGGDVFAIVRYPVVDFDGGGRV